LREEILDAPVTPRQRAALAADMVAANADGDAEGLEREVADGLSDPGAPLTRPGLEALAARAGASGLRRRRGVPFLGADAPAPNVVPELLDELVETIDSARAAETWAPVVRAYAAGFLLRLVQPFEGDAERVAFRVEVRLLAADGMRADRMLLRSPSPDAAPRSAAPAATSASPRPDPDAELRVRVDGLVEALGETRRRVRESTARAVLLSFVDRRDAQLNDRQRRLLRHLADEGGADRLTFQQYVRLHAGRRAPSLRSLQRDWQGLRDRSLIGTGDGDVGLGLDALAFRQSTTRNSGP
jgi:hypothetical protein